MTGTSFRIIHSGLLFDEIKDSMAAIDTYLLGSGPLWQIGGTPTITGGIPYYNVLAPWFRRWIAWIYRSGDAVLTPTAYARSLIVRKSLLDLKRGDALYAEMEEEARAGLAEIGFKPAGAVFRRSIEMRNPHVDPLNLVQIEFLRRRRDAGDPDGRTRDLLRLCVQGIAAGMRTTG